MIYDAIIIGGGAAGLFCALSAGRRGKRVLVIEHNAEVGRKILVSGGGRCNFTNIDTSAENFLSQNPHFCKSALSRYTPADFVDLVKKNKIAFYEKTLGQLFCTDSSRQIVDMLVKECLSVRVSISVGCAVTSVALDTDFIVETSHGQFVAKNLVIACGGLSFAKIGASDLGYRIARQFGQKIVETRPSLVALVLEGESYKQLAGLSVNAVVSTGKTNFQENILFTHRGLSGPAILQISNYWEKGRPVSIDLMPGKNAAGLLTGDSSNRQALGNYLRQYLPQRFADEFVKRSFTDKPLYQFDPRELNAIGQRLNRWDVLFRETEGYDRAEVTLGGVSTDELSSQTMESKRVPGLYFIGEVVDVTGWLGGYNFQWAWSSGFAAGTAI